MKGHSDPRVPESFGELTYALCDLREDDLFTGQQLADAIQDVINGTHPRDAAEKAVSRQADASENH